MPEHHVFITEYPGDMNILVGWRDGGIEPASIPRLRSRTGAPFTGG